MKIKRKYRITLVFGGARSGKSSYAGRMAESSFKHPLFLATAEPIDPEMAGRIARHRTARGPKWSCIEEPLDIAGVIANVPADRDGILLDCVTVWLSNVLIKEGPKSINRRKNDFIAALQKVKRNVIIVSNEVGMGIVPDNELGRDFRDYAGWLNQELAGIADKVVFVIAGIPMVIKRKKGKR
ncbi:MAG: bifunctional adenosylcobinamide kinase/adenosylcobinamide-phosphate guanylyltransferase [Kiritimatiellae bacterium]|nr:bifunctional adenosylcobinamide kinase/adenosylcobinamide-phosphate guanylyltransferase [Kiritimatiellia bacterium]MDD5521400.1 bifunctional adenosylcobinamide kinase/adenosylcobinamide-phosphate guanylyltransferase [Kiritimatiellia bacterium]